jgi:hypothetical protein
MRWRQTIDGLPGMASQLRDAVPHGLSVGPDPVLARQDRDALWWVAEEFDGGQVDRIQSPNGLVGEALTCPLQHVAGHGYDVAPAGECLQGADRLALLHYGKPACHSCTHDSSICLREGEGGRDPAIRAPEEPEYFGVVLQ